MSWEVVVAVAKAAANYALEQNKEAKKASQLSKALTRLESNIINETRAVIKAAFKEEDIKDAKNLIERAENKLALSSPTTDDLEEARDLCQRARAELNDNDIAVIAHPHYIAATTLQITIEELLGNMEDARKTARSGAGHLKSLWEDAAKGVDTRFKIKSQSLRVPGPGGGVNLGRLYFYTLDGVRQGQLERSESLTIENMKNHRAKVKIDVLRVLRRTCNIWFYYAFNFDKLFDANIRGSNGLYLTFSPRSYRVRANEDDPNDPYTQFEIFANSNKTSYSMISYCGGSLTVNDVDDIFVYAQYISQRMRFELENIDADITLKSVYLKKYLNIARKNEEPEWVLECRDTSQTSSTKFNFVKI